MGDGSLAFLADSTAKTLDTLGVQRAHLVAHSLGGAVAARLAADHPEKISSLTLIAPASLPGTQVLGEDRTSLTAALKNIPKAVVIASHNDKIVGAPSPAELPSGFRIHWIDSAGHVPQLEAACDVNELIVQSIGG